MPAAVLELLGDAHAWRRRRRRRRRDGIAAGVGGFAPARHSTGRRESDTLGEALRLIISAVLRQVFHPCSSWSPLLDRDAARPSGAKDSPSVVTSTSLLDFGRGPVTSAKQRCGTEHRKQPRLPTRRNDIDQASFLSSACGFSERRVVQTACAKADATPQRRLCSRKWPGPKEATQNRAEGGGVRSETGASLGCSRPGRTLCGRRTSLGSK